MRLKGYAELECERCGDFFAINASDLNVSESGMDERDMGSEIFYFGTHQTVCPECQNDVVVSYDASEYPIGSPNWSETSAEGATVARGFGEIDVDVYFEEELYALEEASGIYIPEEKTIITHLQASVSELITTLNAQPDMIHLIDPREFEEVIAHIFSKNGFLVELTKRSRDGGRDIVALRYDMGIRLKYIIECKRYAVNKPVGVNLVRALYGVQTQEGANKSVLATTSRFTADARKFAQGKCTTKWAMDLKDLNDIRGWLAALGNNK